jgi:hypothetical protein
MKNQSDLYFPATLAAAEVIKERGITALPVEPIALARGLGIEVMAKPASAQGVSGMLLRLGNNFGIAYATHIDSIGFQNFSVAHELGHYFLPGHIDAVLADGDVHESRAGFASGDRYEMEADHFAASLLMPRLLFMDAMRTAGDGLKAIEKLAGLCQTSLTATGIRYAQCSRDPMAVVLSTGDRINYCFMSDALKAVKDLNWIRKGEGLSRGTATFAFNQDSERVRRADRTEDTSDLQDWFAGDHTIQITEEVIGLGDYGKTLTVLTALDIEEKLEEIEEEENLNDSWAPRFRR